VRECKPALQGLEPREDSQLIVISPAVERRGGTRSRAPLLRKGVCCRLLALAVDSACCACVATAWRCCCCISCAMTAIASNAGAPATGATVAAGAVAAIQVQAAPVAGAARRLAAAGVSEERVPTCSGVFETSSKPDEKTTLCPFTVCYTMHCNMFANECVFSRKNVRTRSDKQASEARCGAEKCECLLGQRSYQS